MTQEKEDEDEEIKGEKLCSVCIMYHRHSQIPYMLEVGALCVHIVSLVERKEFVRVCVSPN